MENLTQAALKGELLYSPEDGTFTRLHTASHNSRKGDRAGYVDSSTGYRISSVLGVQYYEHRLAFLYMLGELPPQVDHINHQKTDNRWPNLRAACNTTNSKNRPLQGNSTSGVVGVSWDKSRRKWRAHIQIDGRQRSLGRFVDLGAAISARKAAEVKHNFHSNHGKTL